MREPLARIRERLELLYGSERAGEVAGRIKELVSRFGSVRSGNNPDWSEKDVFLITYADPLRQTGLPSVKVLSDFLSRRLGDLISIVHLLPFYPYTSDDGFAVTDFRKVRPEIGEWSDIREMGQRFRLCFDGVINHVSAASAYMKDHPEFFIALDPETDTKSVLRTRNLPLLHPFGERWLWTTFGPDQVDLNYANPDVLLEILDVLLFYVKNGASVLRLDAIPYLWKKLGTSCAHLPETHEVIKLIRDVLDMAAPGVLLLAETNAPFADNLPYLGNNGDEAQIIYNFNLAPLLLYSIMKGDATHLTAWAKTLVKPKGRTTFINVTATHDGIGMRPTEGLLPEEARKELVQLAYNRKGDVTGKRNSDGSISPYELNLNYFDALNGPGSDEPVETMVARFMLSQAIPLAFQGIPGVYFQSLLGSRSNFEGVKATGRARSINRQSFDLQTLEMDLDAAGTIRNRVYGEYLRLLEKRSLEKAFHPDAAQEVIDAGTALFCVKRTSLCGKESVFAVHNVTNSTQKAVLPCASLILGPYEFAWLKK